MKKSSLAPEVEKLIGIGIALSREQNLYALLKLIVEEARSLTRADAGSLYLTERNWLRFLVSQCDSLASRVGREKLSSLFVSHLLPLNKKSIAGYVALTGEVLNIKDAYTIPDTREYQFSRDFDSLYQYRTRSLLVIPLHLGTGEVIGVLELINCTGDTGKVEPFPSKYESLARSLGSQAAVAIHNSRLAEKLKKAYLDTTFRLSTAAEYRDKETSQHIRRLSHYTALLARKYGLPESMVELIFYASPMHDIGKIGIPDAILLKPGKLTTEEFEVMKAHTTIGGKILDKPESELIALSREIALTHHERYNGAGYPNGLKGEEIPIAGRITALADVFDAMSSKRCYKEAFGDEIILPEIRQQSGQQFDPALVKIFFENWEEVRRIREEYRD